MCDQTPERWGGLQTELGSEQGPVPSKLAQRFGLVAFGEMDADQHGPGALAERFGSHGGEGRASRLAEAGLGEETVGEGFERVEAELTPFLGFDQDPVVIPVGQDVDGQGGDRCGAELGFPCDRGGIEEPMR